VPVKETRSPARFGELPTLPARGVDGSVSASVVEASVVEASVVEASLERVLLITSASWCANSGRRLRPVQSTCRSYQGETVSR
jgi:hypothetical protein